ncbi:hypothetical protein BDK51DRAFT_35067 [Blyttiomyces helicus]|uniref:Uncharacterized protein n=1 Tax=Blyttiomyces helicus TaxID=388810 RepID=A0A4P9WTQ7_9FUNG|nr:hypothetical protein BDK51DRAFT_35067 [Blyttiomyces helicus]|eukprot:RKO94750.1 hypothetical protein BDK51DRAFT_35067 [Blyttiomyces helicus]
MSTYDPLKERKCQGHQPSENNFGRTSGSDKVPRLPSAIPKLMKVVWDDIDSEDTRNVPSADDDVRRISRSDSHLPWIILETSRLEHVLAYDRNVSNITIIMDWVTNEERCTVPRHFKKKEKPLTEIWLEGHTGEAVKEAVEKEKTLKDEQSLQSIYGWSSRAFLYTLYHDSQKLVDDV